MSVLTTEAGPRCCPGTTGPRPVWGGATGAAGAILHGGESDLTN